ncbi:MAG: glutamine--tRNA ligase [Moraxellaceae bacterium]|nr:MAG: glutamine--tRNA ligase [Moraxellaceae bacterium]
MTDIEDKPLHFIRRIIEQDIVENKNESRVATRFPPEPNGYLHIGHAKSICLNFGVAEHYQGTCNLRFDDTNPAKEEQVYIDAIQEDVRWLGFKWQGETRHASHYFDQFYQFALDLINSGKAYICSLSAQETREYRGSLTAPGRNSPYRERGVEENLDLFQRMKDGEFDEGAHVLRAKIDMAAANMNMRDPTLYRIRKVIHHQTGDTWCVYPMYDYAHCISDALEGITHSLCTLEFEDHRPLYDWILNQLDIGHPQQIEFSRLELEYTITSKRKLNQLVVDQRVSGWDDPRMPTIAGLRRRGYTPAALRDFCERIGVTKSENRVEMSVLENCIREDLGSRAPRVMGVLRPLKIVIENYPEDQIEELVASNHPQDESMGTRTLPFAREIYIEQDDFREQANRKFKRLVLEGEVRLRHAYVIKCESVVEDGDGNIIELRCSYDKNTLGKNPEGRKVRGVIHWVSAEHALDAEVRLYDRLCNVPNPGAEDDVVSTLNPDSLETLLHCKVEPGLAKASPWTAYQFERVGYFCVDSKDSSEQQLVFNRTVGLKDSWAKLVSKEAAK